MTKVGLEVRTFHCGYCISDFSFTAITIHFDFDLNCLKRKPTHIWVAAKVRGMKVRKVWWEEESVKENGVVACENERSSYLYCFGLWGWNCAKVWDDVSKCTHFFLSKRESKGQRWWEWVREYEWERRHAQIKDEAVVFI